MLIIHAVRQESYEKKDSCAGAAQLSFGFRPFLLSKLFACSLEQAACTECLWSAEIFADRIIPAFETFCLQLGTDSLYKLFLECRSFVDRIISAFGTLCLRPETFRSYRRK